MSIWAIGKINQPARCFVEATDARTVIDQMESGEVLSPIPADVARGAATVIMLPDMKFSLEAGEVEQTNG